LETRSGFLGVFVLIGEVSVCVSVSLYGHDGAASVGSGRDVAGCERGRGQGQVQWKSHHQCHSGETGWRNSFDRTEGDSGRMGEDWPRRREEYLSVFGAQ